MTTRRKLVVGLATSAAFSPVIAVAQPAGKVTPRLQRVGVLYPGADNSVFQQNFNGFREALVAAGYVDGRNVAFEMRFGDGRELAPLADELTKLRPDVVNAVARSAVVAMHAATSTIPVVAIDLKSDPVASGFAKAIPRPGGNITGVFMDFPELAGKWLEFLKATVPGLANVAVLWDPATGAAQLEAAQTAAQALKLVIYRIEARATRELDAAFRAAMGKRPSGMIVLTSPIFNSGRRTIAKLAARYRLPTLLPFPGYAEDGGLMSYGPDVKTMYAQTGEIAVKVLAGGSPAEIPIQRPTRFMLSFNLKTAKALGLTIPPSVLARADEVFE